MMTARPRNSTPPPPTPRSWDKTFLLATLLGAIVSCTEAPGPRPDAATSLDTTRDLTRDRQSLERRPDLISQDQRPKTIDRCGGGSLLDLSKKRPKEVLQGTLAGLTNQYGEAIRCGGPSPYLGPQRYYTIHLDETMTYRFSLTPTFRGVLYLASACGGHIINADCSSTGATGATTGAIAKDATAQLIFRPPATGDYELVVDALEASAKGAFALTLEVFDVPAAAHCATPAALKLVGGRVSVAASTLGAINEFDDKITCSLGLSFNGPQVYYAIDLEAGSTYRLTLAPDFEASLILFHRATTCQADDIETDCSTRLGSVLPQVPAQTSRSALFSATQTGTYLIAVDATSPVEAGSFHLDIAAVNITDNRLCRQAQPLSFVDAVAATRGDTASSENDLGAHLFCGGPRLVGAQRYFTVALEARPYQLSLQPSFDATLALGSSCATLPIDCASLGLSGATLAVDAQKKGVITFTPTTAGTYVIAIDSADGAMAGTFGLELRALVPPTNGACHAPAPLDLSAGHAEVAGDTGPLQNDLPGIRCGAPNAPLTGPQAYYRLTLPAGKHATITLTPEALFDPALYAFDATTPCDAASVDAACTGQLSDQHGAGLKESLSLVNGGTTDKTYLLAVDSWSPSEVGSYLLEVTLN